MSRLSTVFLLLLIILCLVLPLHGDETTPSPQTAPTLGWNKWERHHFDPQELHFYRGKVTALGAPQLQCIGNKHRCSVLQVDYAICKPIPPLNHHINFDCEVSYTPGSGYRVGYSNLQCKEEGEEGKYYWIDTCYVGYVVVKDDVNVTVA
jgi:hypothetical protein